LPASLAARQASYESRAADLQTWLVEFQPCCKQASKQASTIEWLQCTKLAA